MILFPIHRCKLVKQIDSTETNNRSHLIEENAH